MNQSATVPADPVDEAKMDTVLGSIVQPLLQGCRMAGHTLTQNDMAAFLLKNVFLMKVQFATASCR